MDDEEPPVPLHMLVVEGRGSKDDAFDIQNISDHHTKRIADHKENKESAAIRELAIRHAKEHTSDLDIVVDDDHIIRKDLDDVEYVVCRVLLMCSKGIVFEEMKHITSIVGKSAVEAVRPDLVVVNICKTFHKQVRLRMHIPDAYPAVPLSVDVTSQSPLMTPALCEKVRARCMKAVTACVGSCQLEAAVMPAMSMISENMLCICLEELSQFKQECSSANVTMTLRGVEKTGEVKCIVTEGEYSGECCVAVPDAYPYEMPKFTIQNMNIHPTLSIIFPDNIKRACIVAHRRRLTTAVKNKVFNVTKPEDASSCLYESLRTFVFDLFLRLVRGSCALCKGRILPTDPTQQEEKQGRLELLPCGHVYHFACLDNFMTIPPFLEKNCHVCMTYAHHVQDCNTKISSSNWPSDLKILEKRWASQQMRNREQNDGNVILVCNVDVSC